MEQLGFVVIGSLIGCIDTRSQMFTLLKTCSDVTMCQIDQQIVHAVWVLH